jgi:hypothetical protein
LSANDREHAAEQECGNERSKKERALWLTHGINPLYATENSRIPIFTNGTAGCAQVEAFFA